MTLPKHTKKLVFVLLFVLIGSGMLRKYRTITSSNPITVDQLSERAQEFITTQSSQGTGMWSQVNFPDEHNSHASKTVSVSTPCFSVSLPFAIANQSHGEYGDTCELRAKIISSFGQLTISVYLQPNFDEDVSITMRQKNPQLYTEQSLTTSTFPQSRLFLSTDSIAAFAHKNDTMVVVAMSNLSNPALFDSTVFTTIYNSFELKSASTSSKSNSSTAYVQ